MGDWKIYKKEYYRYDNYDDLNKWDKKSIKVKRQSLEKTLNRRFDDSIYHNDLDGIKTVIKLAHAEDIRLNMGYGIDHHMIRWKWIDTIELLLDHKYIDISINNYLILTLCLDHHDLERFKGYVEKYEIDLKEINTLIVNICLRSGLTDYIFEFINNKVISLNKALLLTLEHNNNPMLKEMLLNMMDDKRCDMSKFKGKFLVLACNGWDLEVVKKILAGKNVDPSASNNRALINSAQRNKLEIVKLLLKDERVNPGECDNMVLTRSYDNNYFEMFELLLADPRTDPSGSNNKIIRKVFLQGNLELAERLLKDERVDPSVNRNECLRYAINRNNTNAIKLLLRQGCVIKKIGKDESLHKVMVNRGLIPNYKSRIVKKKIVPNVIAWDNGEVMNDYDRSERIINLISERLNDREIRRNRRVDSGGIVYDDITIERNGQIITYRNRIG